MATIPRIEIRRRRKAEEYDRIVNEGGEGFNPYRQPGERSEAPRPDTSDAIGAG